MTNKGIKVGSIWSIFANSSITFRKGILLTITIIINNNNNNNNNNLLIK